MDMNLKSNQPVPVRNQQVTVELLTAGSAVIGSSMVNTDANGNAQIADNVAATMIRVTDRFGNGQTTALP
jgi:hypothetical protein